VSTDWCPIKEEPSSGPQRGPTQWFSSSPFLGVCSSVSPPRGSIQCPQRGTQTWVLYRFHFLEFPFSGSPLGVPSRTPLQVVPSKQSNSFASIHRVPTRGPQHGIPCRGSPIGCHLQVVSSRVFLRRCLLQAVPFTGSISGCQCMGSQTGSLPDGPQHGSPHEVPFQGSLRGNPIQMVPYWSSRTRFPQNGAPYGESP
jgi:hypothetical protein